MGRKAGKVEKTTHIGFRVPLAVEKKAKAYAKSKDISASKVYRDFVVAGVAKLK